MAATLLLPANAIGSSGGSGWAALKLSTGRVDHLEVSGHHLDEFDFDQLETNAPVDDQSSTGGKSRVVAKHYNRRSPWNRAARWGFGLLVVLGVLQEAVATYYDRQMTEAAQAVTGRRDVDVHCGRVWDFLFDLRGSANPGFVYWDSTTANLQLPVCMDAAAWSDDPTNPDNRLGIMILTHELAHLSGHYNESETECVAMWTVPQTALAFGGTLEQGRATAQWYANAHNPRMPAEYRAPGCLSGPAPSSPLVR